MKKYLYHAIVVALLAMISVGVVSAHPTCAGHQFQTTDGTHDGDKDGVGCERLPPAPARSAAPAAQPASAPAPRLYLNRYTR